jgi:nucleotide-binding universal stress UspA family protein
MSKIIVPTDFTAVSTAAITYASEMAAATNSQVHLLHIVKNPSDVGDAEKKMNAQALQFGKNFGIISRVGNIFDDIPDVAADEKADIIVMGTHGLQGMQFLVGSNALRIVTESKVPVIIVQSETTRSAKVNRLLLPLDLHQETKQKLKLHAM